MREKEPERKESNPRRPSSSERQSAPAIDRDREFSARQRSEEEDRTARGYDEAVNSGPSRYGMSEGHGGVFGTSGGGSYDRGFQVIERPGIYDRSGGGEFESLPRQHTHGRDEGHFDSFNLESRGPHVGKGPKNYKRSDERIAEDANEMLMRHGEIDASEVELAVVDGTITLTGMVDTRRTKRLIEDVVERVSGVIDVQNQLKVQKLLGR